MPIMINRTFLLIFFCIFTLTVSGQKVGLVEVYNNVLTINSASNWRGKTRITVPINLLKNAKGFYYTVSVDKRNTTRRASRKILLKLLTDKYEYKGDLADDAEIIIAKEQEKYEDINIYLLPSKTDSDLFQKRMNNDYKYLNKWEDVGDEVRFIPVDGPKTLYLGLYNSNMTLGLDVHLQVVARY